MSISFDKGTRIMGTWEIKKQGKLRGYCQSCFVWQILATHSLLSLKFVEITKLCRSHFLFNEHHSWFWSFNKI